MIINTFFEIFIKITFHISKNINILTSKINDLIYFTNLRPNINLYTCKTTKNDIPLTLFLSSF